MIIFKIFSGVISILATIVSLIISILSRMEYQQLYLWKYVDIVIFNWIVDFTLFFIIHMIIGAIIFCISFYQCIEIVKINNQAHKAKNKPRILLENGYYAKVRHPMTTRFLLIIISFFFMICSLIGIALIFLFVLIFILLTLYEEKKILFPIFREKYQEYKNKVNSRFFTIKMKIIIISLFGFMISGAIFNQISIK